MISPTMKNLSVSCAIVFLSLGSLSAAPLDSALVKNAVSRNAGLFIRIDRAEQENRFAEADSLYRVLDRNGALKAPHFLRWARTKEIMGDGAVMAGLYCRAASVDVRILDIAARQLAQAMESAPVDSIIPVFGDFQKCAFGVRGIDTLRMALWFADFYSRHGMDAEELRVLQTATAAGAQLVPRLLGLAREQFIRARFEKTILPARIAWDRTQEPREKKAAARLIYQAFQALHKNDSALVWLSRTEMTSENARIDAVSLYQSCGQLAEAGKNIGLLGPSFIRDTLEVRQRLFSGDTRGAVELVDKLAKSRTWLDQPMESLLWRMRTLLFNGRTDEMGPIFDSQTVDPSWKGTREYYACRLTFQQLSRDPQALAGWSRLEYGIFTGKRPSAAEIAGKRVEVESGTLLLLRLVKDMLAKGEDAAALAVFRDTVAFSDSPEYRYLYAETLVGSGEIGNAQQLLTGIIADSPADIYSEKARVLLGKIQSR